MSLAPDRRLARAALVIAAMTLGCAPYQPVFVEVLGAVSTEKTEGFAEAYTAYFQIDSILIVRPANPSDCRMSEFSPGI